MDIPQESNTERNILLQTILPATVTQKGIDKPVKTYVFYDNGSFRCFITERLKIRLKAASTETKLQLGTMHGWTLVESLIVKDLIVTDVNGKNPVELPRAYTRQEIPAEVEKIPTPEIVSRIEHLKGNSNWNSSLRSRVRNRSSNWKQLSKHTGPAQRNTEREWWSFRITAQAQLDGQQSSAIEKRTTHKQSDHQQNNRQRSGKC